MDNQFDALRYATYHINCKCEPFINDNVIDLQQDPDGVFRMHNEEIDIDKFRLMFGLSMQDKIDKMITNAFYGGYHA